MFPMLLIPPRITKPTSNAVTKPITVVEIPNSMLITCDTELTCTPLPIPNADVTLNGSDLISAAQTEKEGLITELKEILDTMSRQAQLERKAAESTAMQDQMNKIPLKIYIG